MQQAGKLSKLVLLLKMADMRAYSLKLKHYIKKCAF